MTSPSSPKGSEADVLRAELAEVRACTKRIVELEELNTRLAKEIAVLRAGWESCRDDAFEKERAAHRAAIAANTRQRGEVESLTAQVEQLRTQLAAAVDTAEARERLNTPLRSAATKAKDALRGMVELVEGMREGGVPLIAEIDAPARAAIEALDLALGKPSVAVPAVTGTTSDNAPFRQPDSGTCPACHGRGWPHA